MKMEAAGTSGITSEEETIIWEKEKAEKDKTDIRVYGNQLPNCPNCNHYNTLLNKKGQFKCRDCGWTINRKDTVVTIYEGIGHGIYKRYHISRMIDGDRY